MSILQAFQHNTRRFDAPYPHWIIEQPLTRGALAEIAATPIPDGPRAYDGTRAADDGGAGVDGKLRCYVDRDNVHRFPEMGRLIEELMAPQTWQLVGELIGRDLSDAYVRLEIIADRHGFWLKPHKDIREKLMSMLVYCNPHDESEDLGTDIYDSDLNRVKTIPYRDNLGYLFAPGENTWHGFEKKEIRRERRSILINYVTFKTDWKVPKRRAA